MIAINFRHAPFSVFEKSFSSYNHFACFTRLFSATFHYPVTDLSNIIHLRHLPVTFIRTSFTNDSSYCPAMSLNSHLPYTTDFLPNHLIVPNYLLTTGHVISIHFLSLEELLSFFISPFSLISLLHPCKQWKAAANRHNYFSEWLTNSHLFVRDKLLIYLFLIPFIACYPNHSVLIPAKAFHCYPCYTTFINS